MTLESTNDELSRDLALPACQSELLALLDLLVDVIFCLKGSDGRYLAVNQAFVRRTGRKSKRDVVGRQASDLFTPDLATRYEEQDAHVLSTGEPLRDELELIRRADGSLGWYLTTKLPLRLDGEATSSGLASISRDLKTPKSDDADARALGRVVEHVRRHLHERIRVTELAAVAELSAAQLDRRMRRTFGLSPSQYVMRARVDRAAELLGEWDLPLVDVAVQAGFYDQADLTHQFARHTNETPAQFRALELRRAETDG